MLAALYYLLMLLLGFAWYKFGQNLIRKESRGESDLSTKGLVGPVGLLVTSAVAIYLLFALVRSLIRGEVSCIGKGCKVHAYTLATNAGDYWANIFYIAWMVFGLSYAVYVTIKIWYRQ
ncbi:MAG: hypothetical protein LBJ15_07135 [Comamonas sp.]|jgi:hypothetical protein|uniref:hypothetical protein n=1 Tax=Comamonas sp. TaxID=34028 RepID=UPI00281C0D14|nr:hypothetical protein [Comamonas sp.]MDR0213765.1 hypothetical protein [Comamonas sp.]MDR2298696.1 hypothetical protein [Comamonas sp.]